MTGRNGSPRLAATQIEIRMTTRVWPIGDKAVMSARKYYLMMTAGKDGEGAKWKIDDITRCVFVP